MAEYKTLNIKNQTTQHLESVSTFIQMQSKKSNLPVGRITQDKIVRFLIEDFHAHHHFDAEGRPKRGRPPKVSTLLKNIS